MSEATAKISGAEHLVAHAKQLPPVEFRQQDDDEQRDQEDAAERDGVGKVHGAWINSKGKRPRPDCCLAAVLPLV